MRPIVPIAEHDVVNRERFRRCSPADGDEARTAADGLESPEEPRGAALGPASGLCRGRVDAVLALRCERRPDPGIAVNAFCNARRGREIGPEDGRSVTGAPGRYVRLVAPLASVRSALDARATGGAPPRSAGAARSVAP